MEGIVVTIAGDSGDGVQLLGNIFADNVAIENYELNTLPDFPAEIRAPAGTIHGVSGFQIQFGVGTILTAGNKSDVFIAFNAAALKKYFKTLKPNGTLIYDSAGFDAKNCKLAQFDLKDLDGIEQRKIEIPLSKLTKEILENSPLSEKDKDKNKNIFALGLLSFGIHSDLRTMEELLMSKFKGSVLDDMHTVLRKGYHYGETIELFIQIAPKNRQGEKNNAINITGNKAISKALIDAPNVFGRNIFFGGYPITPASDILHELSKHQNEYIVVKQAEDEIAAAGMALGASFGGSIGVTASSGPGIDLKQETIGLAHMAEIPMLIIDVQRAGPSTGMPTKIEQSDLNLVLKGRHGDCPVPVLAIKSPSHAYSATINAIKIAIKYQTPVYLLSDALIANGSELWEQKKEAHISIINEQNDLPFLRNEFFVRPWMNIGKEGINYIAGGLEKDQHTGTISYDGDNHQKMVEIREKKILNAVNDIPEASLEAGSKGRGVLLVSWGSTYGAAREAMEELAELSAFISHLHMEWIYPLPKGSVELLEMHEKIIVAELNNGQLAAFLGEYTSKPIIRINKLKGSPFFKSELVEMITPHLL